MEEQNFSLIIYKTIDNQETSNEKSVEERDVKERTKGNSKVIFTNSE